MRLPLSPPGFDVHGCPAAAVTEGSAAVRRKAWQLQPDPGPAQPVAVALPPEPASHRLALEALAQRPDEAVSLAFALPFCAAHCLCCDRDIHAAQPDEVIADYVTGLIEETRTLSQRIGVGRDVLQLHLGGGSASELEEAQLARLVHAVRESWRLPADAEMSIDCDPRRVGWMQLQLLSELGFSRINFGVLDLDLKVQMAIGRRHSVALIDDACELARSCGIGCINLQLMIGLPHQCAASWRDTLRRVIAIAPDRITLACYRHRPQQAPGQYAIDADALPQDDECRALMALTAELLADAGYLWIGADQFVLETDVLAEARSQGRLRHSLISYTAMPPSALLAHGVAAAGELDGQRFSNTTSMPAWRQAVRGGRLPVVQAQPTTPWLAQLRQAQQQLLCSLELPRSMLRDELQPAYDRLAQHARSGWVQLLEDRLIVTDAGRLALPVLCAELEMPVSCA